MTKFFFFDLDGTLRQPKSGAKFINKPEDQEPIPSSQEAVKYYADKGFVCIGITNQGGVAAGHKTLDDAIKEQQITLELFPELSEIFFCPNYGGESCWQVSRDNSPLEFKAPQPEGYIDVSCRKPGHGMILIAAKGLSDDLSDCWMVGDRNEDQECAAAAGVNFVWATMIRCKFDRNAKPETLKGFMIDTKTLSKFLSL